MYQYLDKLAEKDNGKIIKDEKVETGNVSIFSDIDHSMLL